MSESRDNRKPHLSVVASTEEPPASTRKGRAPSSELCNDIADDLREWINWIAAVRADPSIEDPEAVIAEAEARQEAELQEKLRRNGLR